METASINSRRSENLMDPHQRPGYRKLSVLNGLLIGAALALGSWGLNAWRLSGLPVENSYTSFLLAGLSMIVLCGLTGWLTGRLARSWLTVLLWFVVSMLCALIIGYQPTIGRTVAEWLADAGSWGLPIYAAQGVTYGGLILGGLLIGLISMFLDYVFGVNPPLSYQTSIEDSDIQEDLI